MNHYEYELYPVFACRLCGKRFTDHIALPAVNVYAAIEKLDPTPNVDPAIAAAMPIALTVMHLCRNEAHGIVGIADLVGYAHKDYEDICEHTKHV